MKQLDNKSKNSTPIKKEVTVNDIQYLSINLHGITNLHPHVHTKGDKEKIIYWNSHIRTNKGTLVDRGANGEYCSDVRIIHKIERIAGIQGIQQHQVNDTPHIAAGNVVQT